MRNYRTGSSVISHEILSMHEVKFCEDVVFFGPRILSTESNTRTAGMTILTAKIFCKRKRNKEMANFERREREREEK